MQEEFVKKLPSQDSEGHGRHAPAPSRSTQADAIIDGRSEKLHQRLDRLESLILQLSEKLVAAEGGSSKRAPTQSGSQLEQVNLRLDRIETVLSQLSTDFNRPNQRAESRTDEKTTQTDAALERIHAFE